jgi:hypothetical protein
VNNILYREVASDMSAENDELFKEIEKKVGRFAMGGDGDRPEDYSTKLWKRDTSLKISLEELIIYGGYLKRLDLDYFWQEIPEGDPLNISQEYIRAYQALVQPIQLYIDDLEIYQIQTSQMRKYHRDAIVYLIFAKTKIGSWLGLSVEVSYALEADGVRADPVFEVRDFARSRIENRDLITALENAVIKMNKLIHLVDTNICRSGNDEINRAIWTLNEDRALAFSNLLLQTKLVSVIKYMDVSSIEELQEDAEESECDEFNGQIFNFDRATSRLIAENFTNLRYYYIGSTLIDIYLVGQAKNGDWLTIDTSVVWA